jgi:hypothetical protein
MAQKTERIYIQASLRFRPFSTVKGPAETTEIAVAMKARNLMYCIVREEVCLLGDETGAPLGVFKVNGFDLGMSFLYYIRGVS